MYYYILISIITILILLFLYIQLRRDAKALLKQLRYTRAEESMFHLFTSYSNKSMNEIIQEVNIMKEATFQEKSAYLKNERDIHEMIANISHDIRTPLTSIQGYVEMMQSCEDLNERARYYEIVSRRLLDLETILDEFFLYTKLVNTKEPLLLEQKEVYPIVCQVVLGYIDLLKTNGLEPQVLCDDENIVANIHEESFRRISMNLIMNTIRYGTSPFLIHLRKDEKGIYIIFENGCPNEIDIKHLFDRFYKGDKARSGEGSGLGLAIVKELTERMNGTVEAVQVNSLLKIIIKLPIKG